MTAGWRIGSLFSGIGGLDLGLERAGLGRVAWQCEVDPWCRAVLAQHWPDAVRFDDVRALAAPPPVEVLCGGFPCQPVSVAGKRLAQADQRWLWPEFARLVRVVRPRVVVAENVPGLATAGLELVLGDVAALGYDAAWDVLSAAAVGAPHRRERLFIVAWDTVVDADRERASGGGPGGDGCDAGRVARHLLPAAPDAGRGRVADRDDIPGRAPVRQRGGEADGGGAGAMGDPDRPGLAVGVLERRDAGAEQPAAVGASRTGGAAESGMGGNFDGVSSGLDGHRWPAGRGEPQHAWEPPRTARQVEDRAARLKALGNAVVPQVAEAVGRWALQLIQEMP